MSLSLRLIRNYLVDFCDGFEYIEQDVDLEGFVHAGGSDPMLKK